MKTVLLLGDSIRMGYDDKVRDLLRGRARVVYDAEDNGRFAAYTLWQANQLLRKYGPVDVVHWNNGYWDMNIESPMQEPIHPLPEYRHFLKRILALCRGAGAQVIFATTLPVPGAGGARDGGTGASLHYQNDWVLSYNAEALAVMREENAPVNDLYALCAAQPGLYKCEDGLHLTEEGYDACAHKIASVLEKYL